MVDLNPDLLSMASLGREFNTANPKQKQEPDIIPEDPNIKVREENLLRVQNNIKAISDSTNGNSDIIRRYMSTEGSDVFLPAENEVDNANIGTVSLNFAAGAVADTMGLVSLPFMLTDAIGFGIRRAFDRDATFEPTVSGMINQGGQNIADIIDPNTSFSQQIQVPGATSFAPSLTSGRDPDTDTVFANRTARAMGGFIAPGGLIVKGMTNKGAKLLKDSPDIIRWWQRMLIDMAKNPAKTQAVEAGLGAIGAVSGEVAATGVIESGGDQATAGYFRLGAELGSVVGSVFSFRILSRAVRFAKEVITPTEALRIAAAERNGGRLLNELSEIDPNMLDNWVKGEKIVLETGLQMNLAEITKNADIQSTLDNFLKTSSNTGQSRFITMINANRPILKEFISTIRPTLFKSDGKVFRTELRDIVDNKMADIETRVSLTERKALNEAEALNPNRVTSSSDTGEHAVMQLELLEESAEDAANVIFDVLNPDTLFKANKINMGIRLSQFSPGNAKESLTRVASGGSPLGVTARQNFGDIPDIIQQIMKEDFIGQATVPLHKIRDFRTILGQEERLARRRGITDVADRLAHVRRGIDAQLSSPVRGASRKAADSLREANRLWTEKFARFSTAYERVGIQRDLDGMFNFSPENFGRIFIRPEGRKRNVEAARRFREIFGTDKNGQLLPQARALLRDTVTYELSSVRRNTDGTVNPDRIKSWLTSHQNNLKAHGLWDEFKNTGKSARLAEEARTDLELNRRLYDSSMLATAVNSPNITKTINKLIEAGTLSALRAEVRLLKNTPAERGLIQEVFDALIKKSERKKFDSATNLLRKPDELAFLLQENETVLRQTLGNGHFRNISIVADTLQRTERSVQTVGGRGLFKLVGDADSEQRVASATAKIYAAARGFISPHFVVGSLAREGIHVINSRAARNVVEQMLYDPAYAKKLMQIARTEPGREAFRRLRAAMIPPTLDAINTDDERTQ